MHSERRQIQNDKDLLSSSKRQTAVYLLCEDYAHRHVVDGEKCQLGLLVLGGAGAWLNPILRCIYCFFLAHSSQSNAYVGCGKSVVINAIKRLFLIYYKIPEHSESPCTVLTLAPTG